MIWGCIRVLKVIYGLGILQNNEKSNGKGGMENYMKPGLI